MDDGLSFDAGDRQMTFAPPSPLHSPTTRGLLTTRQVSIGQSTALRPPCPVVKAPNNLLETSRRWTTSLDQWDDDVRLQRIGAIATTRRPRTLHRRGGTPVRPSNLDHHLGPQAAITGSSVQEVLQKTRGLPETEGPLAPDQEVLDLILVATQGS
jgi:hypothetical protein